MKTNIKYLQPKSAVEYPGITTSKLAKKLVIGNGLQFMKIGWRAVIYDNDRLDEWLCSKIYKNTSRYGSEVPQ